MARMYSRNSVTQHDTMTGLEACSLYHIFVNARSLTGLKGPEADVTGITDEIEPSLPRNFQAKDVTQSTVTLEWLSPEVYFFCFFLFKIF